MASCSCVPIWYHAHGMRHLTCSTKRTLFDPTSAPMNGGHRWVTIHIILIESLHLKLHHLFLAFLLLLNTNWNVWNKSKTSFYLFSHIIWSLVSNYWQLFFIQNIFKVLTFIWSILTVSSLHIALACSMCSGRTKLAGIIIVPGVIGWMDNMSPLGIKLKLMHGVLCCRLWSKNIHMKI